MNCTLCHCEISDEFAMCDACYFSVTRIDRKNGGKVVVESRPAVIYPFNGEPKTTGSAIEAQCGCIGGNCSDLTIEPHKKKGRKKKQ